MKLTDFDALSFDCYGTLIDWESGIHAALETWTRRHGLDSGRDELLALFARFESAREAERPALLYPDLLARVLGDIADHFGITASAGEAAAFGASVKDWPAFPDSAEALAYLKKHYKLAIVSNVDRASFKHSNAKLGIEFDVIVTAEDVGAYKPDHAHFHRVFRELAALGVPKERILHTAQSLFHDHVPAKALGMTTLWVNRRSEAPGWGATKPPPVAVTPDWEVPSMAALADLHKAHMATG